MALETLTEIDLAIAEAIAATGTEDRPVVRLLQHWRAYVAKREAHTPKLTEAEALADRCFNDGGSKAA